jgi:hypothetical protein
MLGPILLTSVFGRDAIGAASGIARAFADRLYGESVLPPAAAGIARGLHFWHRWPSAF